MRERVKGPYAHRRKWRIVHVGRDSSQSAYSFETKEQAEAAIKALRKRLNHEEVTIDVVLSEYGRYQELKGNKPVSVSTTRIRLRSLLTDIEESVVRVDRKRADKLYEALVGTGASVDTHRNTLNQTKTFWRWLIKRGYAKVNPWLEVDGIGKRNCGKEQLSINEAVKLSRFCEDDGSKDAAVTLCCIQLNLRASEVARLKPKDVDGFGSILHIGESKSRAGEARKPILSPVLSAMLAEHLPFEISRYQVLAAVKRTCAAAGVSVITAQGLRGTHATLRTLSGQQMDAIAAAMGHSSPAVTQRHYIAPGATGAADQAVVLRVLSGGRGA